MKKVIYTKYANERAEKFSVRTDIIEEEGKKYIIKTPVNSQAKKHVFCMCRIYEKMSSVCEAGGFKLAPCKEQGTGAAFNFICGDTLEEKLDMLLMDGKTEQAEKELLEYCHQVYDMFSKEPFQVTEEFREIFGNVQLRENLLCAEVNNIDMVAGNLIFNGEEKYIIDYEWSFFFPVPSAFIIYRILHYYMYANELRRELRGRGLFEKCSITEEEISVYSQMEKNFQRYISEGQVPLREMYPMISPGTFQVVDWANIAQEKRRNSILQVFFSMGAGYREEDSQYFPMKNYRIDIEVDIPKGATNIRIDPGATYTLCHVEKLCFDNSTENIEEYNTCGSRLTDNWIVFDEMDPQITVDTIPSGVQKVLLGLSIISLEEELLKLLKNNHQQNQNQISHLKGALEQVRAEKAEAARIYEERVKEKEKENFFLNEKIHAMQGTKVWKIYKKYRELTGRKLD